MYKEKHLDQESLEIHARHFEERRKEKLRIVMEERELVILEEK